MTNAVAYVLGGPDIKAYFFEGAPTGIVCPGCNACLDRSYIPASLHVHERVRYNFGYTWDHQQLFSKSLIEIITGSSKHCGEVSQIPDSGGYFRLTILETIAFDAERRKTKFGPRCEVCEQYKWVAGATPAFVTTNQILPDEIFKSDLEFGGSVGRSPLLIIGTKLKAAIEQLGVSDLHFHDVCSSQRRRSSLAKMRL